MQKPTGCIQLFKKSATKIQKHGIDKKFQKLFSTICAIFHARIKEIM